MNDPQRSTSDATRLPETAPDPKAIAAALAPQETTYDEGGLRFYVTRREARVDVRFRTLREATPDHPDMEPLWLLTAIVCDDGLRLIDQEQGSGEDAEQFFPSLAAHLAANPLGPMPDALDARYLVVSGLDFRARRFSRGFGEMIRVDLRVKWKDGTAPSWLHAIDAELMPSMLGHAATLTVRAASMMHLRNWGQIQHLVPFATYCSFLSRGPSETITAQLTDYLKWADNDGVFAAKAVA